MWSEHWRAGLGERRSAGTAAERTAAGHAAAVEDRAAGRMAVLPGTEERCRTTEHSRTWRRRRDDRRVSGCVGSWARQMDGGAAFKCRNGGWLEMLVAMGRAGRCGDAARTRAERRN